MFILPCFLHGSSCFLGQGFFDMKEFSGVLGGSHLFCH